MNYYKRHIGDYMKDASHLSLLEHGVYMRLLDVYYTREAPIPVDQAARLISARTKEEKAALEVVTCEFFMVVDGAYTQTRCDSEIATMQQKTETNREVGRLGGRPRKETQTVSDGNPEITQTVSENNPNLTLATSHKPVTNSHSERDAGAPATRPDPEKQKPRSTTLAAYIDVCRAAGVKPIPEDHHIRRYCTDAGITDEMTAIAWLRFREEHTTGARKAKRYIDWAETFANCVKSSWYGLWVCNAEGPANWTSKGLQEKRVADARRAEKEAAHEHA